MEAPRQHQQFANQTQQRTFVQTPSMIHPDCAMNTRREIERPGAIKVPGTGSRNMQAAVGTGSMNRDVTNLPVENIQLLCNMGFTRNQAIYALQEKNNNVAEAADLLLTAS
jgi:NACalpha-BTF3-like transcription factor